MVNHTHMVGMDICHTNNTLRTSQKPVPPVAAIRQEEEIDFRTERLIGLTVSMTVFGCSPSHARASPAGAAGATRRPGLQSSAVRKHSTTPTKSVSSLSQYGLRGRGRVAGPRTRRAAGRGGRAGGRD